MAREAAAYDALLAALPAADDTGGEASRSCSRRKGSSSSTTAAPPPADPNLYRTQVEAQEAPVRRAARAVPGAARVRRRQARRLRQCRCGDDPARGRSRRDAVRRRRPAGRDRDPARNARRTRDERGGRPDEADRRRDGHSRRGREPRPPPRPASSSSSRPARRVLGDETRLMPRFTLGDDRGIEFEHCLGGSAALLTDLHAAGRRFPVDDWLYGVARVRDKLSAWENTAVVSEAFGASRRDLTPLQLPFRADDRWLALEFDRRPRPATACSTPPTSRRRSPRRRPVRPAPRRVAGARAGPDVISGVTFHFDRPSSQPPQAMLLAVPPALTGSWQLGRPRRDAQRDARGGEVPRGRAGAGRRLRPTRSSSRRR